MVLRCYPHRTAHHCAYLDMSVSVSNPGSSWVLGLGSWVLAHFRVPCPACHGPFHNTRPFLCLCFSQCDRTAHLTVLPRCLGLLWCTEGQPVYRWPLNSAGCPCPSLLRPVASFFTAQPLTTTPPFLYWRRPRRLASLIGANSLVVDPEIIRNPLSLCHIPCMPPEPEAE